MVTRATRGPETAFEEMAATLPPTVLGIDTGGAFAMASAWNSHSCGSPLDGSGLANRTASAANTTSVQASDAIDSRPVSDRAGADFGTISPYPTVVAVTSEKYMNVGMVGLAGSPANDSAPASRQTAAKSVEKIVTIAR
jgi:hypothetical protein